MVMFQLRYSLFLFNVLVLEWIFSIPMGQWDKKDKKLSPGWLFLLSKGCSGSWFLSRLHPRPGWSNTRALLLFWEVSPEFRKILSAPCFSNGITKSLGTMTSSLFAKRCSTLRGSLLDLLEKNSTQNQLWSTTSTITALTRKN